MTALDLDLDDAPSRRPSVSSRRSARANTLTLVRSPEVLPQAPRPLIAIGSEDPGTLALDRLDTVSLTELVEHAALMHRTDRKYFAPLTTVRALVDVLSDSHRVLEIDGRWSTHYRTLYYDTENLDACRHHVQKRRRRWKVRSRLYVEDGLCRIEVKTKDNRGQTHKVMGPSDPSRYGHLSGAELDFVAIHLGATHPEVDAGRMVQSAEVSYRRATLADLDSGTRVTIDWNLHCRLEAGDVWIDPAYALIETKGPVLPSVGDRALSSLGTRPRSFSKYAAAVSMMTPTIADNDVRFLQGSILHHRFKDT